MVEEDPDIRTGKTIALGSYRTLLQDDESSGEEDSDERAKSLHSNFKIFLKGPPEVDIMFNRRIFER